MKTDDIKVGWIMSKEEEIAWVIRDITEGKKNYVNIPSCGFNHDDLLKILGELKNSKTITKVSHGCGYFLGDKVVDNIAVAEGFGALLCHKNIKSLLLSRMKFTYDAFAKFVSKAGFNVTLTSLELSGILVDKYNFLADKHSFLVANILQANTSITKLNLENNGLYGDCLKDIAEALKCNFTLKSLNLSGNRFSADNTQALTVALRSNTTLTELNLSNIYLNSDSVPHIKSLLVNNMAIRILDLSSNYGIGIKPIIEGLSLNKSLQILDLQKTGLYHHDLDEKTTDEFSKLLGLNKTLTTLQIDFVRQKQIVDPIITRNQKYQDEVKKYFFGKQSEPYEVTLGALWQDFMQGKCPVFKDLTIAEIGGIATHIQEEASGD